nr:hypothetical protein [Tanacetum cinerariifolium]
MNTPSEETPRVKPSGSAGSKNRQISIGIKTSGKSSGEEVNSVPNYLRASTGSCHDICKYGKRYEHLNSAISIQFDKEKVAKTVVPVEKKKTTTVKPSPVMVNRDVSARSNAGVKKKEIKIVKKAEATRKTAESLKATKSKSAKKVAPLKDQNQMQKSEPEQNNSDKVQTQALQDGEAKSEVYIESIKFDFIYSSMKLKDPLACDSSLVQIEALDGFDTEHEVRLKTMEFDFILPSMELVDPSVCNESEPFSCNGSGEEELLITYTLNERFEPILDEEQPKNSTIMPTVIESSHAFLNKEVSEESLIAPSVSQSTQDEGVLEDESKYTDDHNEEVEVSEDNEKEINAAQNDEMETTARVQYKVRRKGRGVISKDKDDKGVNLKFRRGKVLDIHQSENNDSKKGCKSVFLNHQGEQEKKDAHGLWNNIIKETASKLSKTANPLPRNVTNIQVWRLSNLQMKTCEYSMVLVLWGGTMLAILYFILCLFS